MKLKIDTVLFINLCSRLILLHRLLENNGLDESRISAPIRPWLDPISKRVILFVINGLSSDFLRQNSSTFLRSIEKKEGAYWVSLVEQMETNSGGLKSILSGVTGHSSPLFWMRPRYYDSILKYTSCKCGMGQPIPDPYLDCFVQTEEPFEKFFSMPGLFEHHNTSCLFIYNYNFDPVSAAKYKSKLRKLDRTIQFITESIENFWRDHSTTFLLTSTRGSPVGKITTTNVPVLAWGKGISATQGEFYMRHIDLTALMCLLLGVNFPKGLFGLAPSYIMDLSESTSFQVALYTIKHFEEVLQLVKPQNKFKFPDNSDVESLMINLHEISLQVNEMTLSQWFLISSCSILLFGFWGFILLTMSSSGFVYFNIHLKSVFLVLFCTFVTFLISPAEISLKIPLYILFTVVLQNGKQIHVILGRILLTFFLGGTIVFLFLISVVFLGHNVILPVLLVPVTLWPLCNGNWHKINQYVLFTRVASGIVLGVLPFSRNFGENPDSFVVVLMTLIFLFKFYCFLSFFKRSLDYLAQVNYFAILINILFLSILYTHPIKFLNFLSYPFLAFSLISTYLVSGRLIDRYFNILLALTIPVQMICLRIELVFYFAAVFHIFTWIFTEYHYHPKPPGSYHENIFFADPVKTSNRFLLRDYRQIFFFLFYCYLFYFAIGNYPSVHSYDLYVYPFYVSKLPGYLSVFLGAFKFFLPFFIPTLAFIIIFNLVDKSSGPLIAVTIWLCDITFCIIIGYTNVYIFAHRALFFREFVFPFKFSYLIVYQFANMSIILSYILSKYLLFCNDWFTFGIFRKKRCTELSDDSEYDN